MTQKKMAARTYSTDLERVIARTAVIENMLNQVVTNYCVPRQGLYRFYWNVLLDSSVMPMGSKVKVAMAISQMVKQKLNRDALHKVMSLRNAFAHHGLDSHPVFYAGKNPDDHAVTYYLHLLDHQGRLSRIARADAVAQFDAAYSSAKESLKALLVVIKSEQAKAAA